MRILVIICLLIPVLGSAQLTVNPETKLFTYETTQKVDSMKAADLFTKAKEWLVLKSAKISGEVAPSMMNATMTATCTSPMSTLPCTINVTIRTKDGAVRLTLDRFTYNTSNGQTPLETQFGDPEGAIAKKKRVPAALEAMGNDLAASLLKHLKAKSDF